MRHALAAEEVADPFPNVFNVTAAIADASINLCDENIFLSMFFASFIETNAKQRRYLELLKVCPSPSPSSILHLDF